jgi:hypothetical protein
MNRCRAIKLIRTRNLELGTGAYGARLARGLGPELLAERAGPDVQRVKVCSAFLCRVGFFFLREPLRSMQWRSWPMILSLFHGDHE